MLRFLSLSLILLFCWPAQALQAGAAKADITPPLGTPMNGYGYRMGRGATEVHDPITVRSLYLEEGSTKLLLVTADLCVINRELRERVLELAPAEVPGDNIILTATHTHNGQGGMVRPLVPRLVSGPFVPEVLEQTARGFADAMRAAYESRRRGAIGFGTTTQTVLSVNRSHPGGPIDPQIGVIRVDDSDGNPIAIVTNFAAHPTTISKDFAFALSADYPGYFCDALEELSSPGCIALFMNGAEGNQACGNPENKEGWERTESIGRLLAILAKGVYNRITCSELPLAIRSSSPTLPRTMADSTLPGTTFLQTLEIGGLLLTFFPGEPCVEIGLEMRRRALSRGYAAQFTVGLANDHLMYFVPPDFYSHPHYEAGMNFYGPGIADWFYREFSVLLSRGKPEQAPGPGTPAERAGLHGGTAVTVRGSAYQIGFARAKVFGEGIRAAYENRVVAPVRDGSVTPDSGFWDWAPAFIDRTPLALPLMAQGARALLAGLSPSLVEEIRGMANAVELPFDAIWLLQNAPTYVRPTQREGLFPAAFCTLFAVTGDRAGADGLLVGRNLDWDLSERAAVIEAYPESGHGYVQVGFEWNAGVFSGMNDAGLTLCVERAEALGNPGFDAPPVEFVIRDILLSETTLEGAVKRIQSHPGIRGYHVLVADPALSDAVVLELGSEITVRKPVNGLLLGTDPAALTTDSAARSRYERVLSLFEEERIIAVTEIQDALADRQRSKTGKARIFNEFTAHSVVFEPKSRTIHVAFPNEDGRPGAFETIRVERGEP